MSVFAETQEASVSLLSLRVRALRRFSIASVRSPVSIALELATALKMLARETVTLAEAFLRIIKRLHGKISLLIITSGGHRVLQTVQWGSGMSRIRELCQKAGNPEPAFSESGDFVDIEFSRDTSLAASDTEETGGSIGGQIGGLIPELTERQREVLALIQENPSISRQVLADKLNINASAVQKHLDKLKEAGAIERIGGTRGYWQVKV